MLNFRIHLILFLVFSITRAFANYDSAKVDSIKKERGYYLSDTSAVNERKFSTEQIQKLKSDPDLKYHQPPTVAESLWDRFKQWLAELISQLLRGATTTNIGRIIMYALGGALLVALIMMLMKVNAFRVFISGGDVNKPSYQTLDENIHEMDFEKLIAEALDKKDFRIGTRLVFLYALKILSDQQLIDWNPGKTNHDYVEELQREDLKTGFKDLSIYFDYAWYGNFKVSAEVFQNVRIVFDNWKEQAGR